ncbi:hypothetical protein Tsp_00488 [Trichinella spiralis]|uniref:hypothetical protein n=1 Tax=Trichinella spiralis TaxID=6334 RepID=UPI0001EFB89A|nr:hypothetical protein Tsp_00488 [Trichinella spiralis]
MTKASPNLSSVFTKVALFITFLQTANVVRNGLTILMDNFTNFHSCNNNVHFSWIQHFENLFDLFINALMFVHREYMSSHGFEVLSCDVSEVKAQVVPCSIHYLHFLGLLHSTRA